MSTTAYGYKIPEFEDPSATWMDYLEDNWTRISAHDHDGTDSVKLTVSSLDSGAATSGQVITANGSGGASWANQASAFSSVLDLKNVGLSVTESGDDIIIALKTQDGGDPDSTDYCQVGFRSSTAASGSYNSYNRTSALSLTLAGAVTLGGASAVARRVYVYLIDTDGTASGIRLGASLLRMDDRVLTSTSTTGTSNQVIYTSGSAYTTKPIRCIGSFTATNTTNTWGAPSPVNVGHQPPQIITAMYELNSSTGNAALADDTAEVVDFNAKLYDPLNCVTTGASWVFTAPCAGRITVSASLTLASRQAGTVNNAFSSQLFIGSTFQATLGQFRYQINGAAVTASTTGTKSWDVSAGDTVYIKGHQNSGDSVNFETDAEFNQISITLIPTQLI